MVKKSTPPAHLSREARELWRRLQQEYAIDDPDGRLLLLMACEALDRLRDCQQKIKTDGAVVIDRFGQKKGHPMLAVERDARSQIVQCLRALNLDTEAVGPIGRPAGK